MCLLLGSNSVSVRHTSLCELTVAIETIEKKKKKTQADEYKPVIYLTADTLP